MHRLGIVLSNLGTSSKCPKFPARNLDPKPSLEGSKELSGQGYTGNIAVFRVSSQGPLFVLQLTSLAFAIYDSQHLPAIISTKCKIRLSLLHLQLSPLLLFASIRLLRFAVHYHNLTDALSPELNSVYCLLAEPHRLAGPR